MTFHSTQQVNWRHTAVDMGLRKEFQSGHDELSKGANYTPVRLLLLSMRELECTTSFVVGLH